MNHASVARSALARTIGFAICFGITAAAAAADGDACRQWQVPSVLVAKQSGGQEVTFQLAQDGPIAVCKGGERGAKTNAAGCDCWCR